jgi:hypothetical protein
MVILFAFVHVETLELHFYLAHSFVTLNGLSVCHATVTLPLTDSVSKTCIII